MHRFTDIHTHVPGRSGSVLSLPVCELDAGITQCYSLQLHPWHLKGKEDIEAFLIWGRSHASDPLLVAIGECGLDPLCSTPMHLQHEAFLMALRLAKELHKPVIIHCVKMWNEMLADVSQVLTMNERLELPLIVHGFRKGPQLARQLLDAGFSLSLGRYYNEATLQLIPAERLYFETDDVPV